MIFDIEISNFQSHKSTKIEFCKGLNVICGASDSGKSSILRALAWLIKNRPSGDSIRNWNCKKGDPVEVKIVLNDNGKTESISKVRTGSTSKYISSKFGTLDVVGREVPSEVTEQLNLSDSNFQTQHDSYFLLNDSPGTVAKVLNEIIGLSVIDRTYKNINGKTQKAKSKADLIREQIEELEKEIDSFDGLDVFEKNLQEVESLCFEQESLQEEMLELEVLIRNTKEINNKLEEIQLFLRIDKDYVYLQECKKVYDSLQNECNEIDKILNSIKDIKEVLRVENDWLAVEKPYSVLTRLIGDFEQLLDEEQEISAILEKHYLSEEKLGERKLIIKNKKDELTRLLSDYKMCPLCFRILDKKTINDMVEK